MSSAHHHQQPEIFVDRSASLAFQVLKSAARHHLNAEAGCDPLDVLANRACGSLEHMESVSKAHGGLRMTRQVRQGLTPKLELLYA
jgi:hypothetical protein